MRTLRFFISLIILLSVLLPAIGTDPAHAARKIIVAVPPDFPPTYYRDEKTGTPKGFAIDVMNEVARRAGLEVEYVFGRPWDELQEMLLSGKADLIPNLTIDETRKQKFIFTLPVETVPANLIVRKDNRKATALTPGMNVGCMKGSISYDNLKSRTDIQLKTYESLQHLLFDLLAGHVDMISVPTPNVMKLAIDAGVEEQLNILVPPLRESKRAMALRREDTELLEKLDVVIDDFVGSDKYKEIYTRWWGKPRPYWTTNRVKTLAGSIFIVTLIGMAYWRFRSITTLNSQLSRSEKKYRELFNGSNDAIFVREFSDVEGFGRMLDVNDTSCRFLGYTRNELLNLKIEEINVHNVSAKIHTWRKSLSETACIVFDSIYKTRNGKEIPVEINSHKFELDGRTVVLSIVRDTTERKKAEEALRESEYREKERANEFNAIMESVPAAILIAHDIDGRLITGNRSACKLLRVPFEGNFSKRATNGEGPNHYIILHNGIETLPGELPLQRAIRGEHVRDYQQEVHFDDGTRIALFGSAIPLLNEQGLVRGAVAAFLDVTNQIQTSEALRESEERYRTLFEQSPDGVTLVDPNTFEIQHFNDAACRDLGYTRQEFARLTIQDLDPVEDLPVIQERTQSLMETGKATFETIHNTKQGDPRNVEVHHQFVTVSGRPVVCAIFHDITERKQSEAALKVSEEKFRTFVESSIDVIFVLNAEGIFQFVSSSWEKHFGYPACSVIGHDFKPLIHPEDVPLCLEYLFKILTTGDSGISPNYRVKHADGSWRTFTANGTSYVDTNGTLLYLGVGRDISDQKRAEDERIELERRLLHGQKLESLGVLAGGIAHDFNNLLAAILGNLDLALMRLPQASPVRNNIEKSMLASRRASDLTRQMLDYAGKGLYELKEIDLNEIVRDNIDLFKAVVPRNVAFSANTESALQPIIADPGQIQQVVMNLITNAVEAVGSKQGVVTLSTGVTTCDDCCIQNSRLEEKPAPGEFVYVEVSDNGCGMDEKTQRRLFEPFFTTKFTGRGLGMAATQGIVKTHKGIILLESTLEEGSTFRILIPVIDGTITQTVGPFDRLPQGTSPSVNRTGKVLVVDDEDIVRALGVEYVKYLGFEAIEAGDGIEALELYSRHADDIAFVILDLTMPKMDGVTAFYELKKIRPGVRVMLCSGYSEHVIIEHFKQEKPDCFIQKPYQLKELEFKIANTMNLNKVDGNQV